MIPELIAAASFAAGGGAGIIYHQIRNSWGKNPDPAAPKPPKDMSLAEVMTAGNKVVAQMARDVHKLYHPPDEDGNPCACAYCEIRADDEPEPEPPKPVVKKRVVRSKQSKPDYDKPNPCCERGFPNAAPGQHWECPKCKNDWQAVDAGPLDIRWRRMSGRCMDQADFENDKLKTQVKNLEDQLAQLSDAYSKLKIGQDKKVVTKTVERESYMQSQFNELARIADAEGQVIQLTLEIQGRPVQITCGPQRAPDVELEQWGESETIKKWTPKPHKIEIGVGRK